MVKAIANNEGSSARQPDDRLLLTTSAGKAFLAKTVFIAAGVGAFVPKRIAIEGNSSGDAKLIRSSATDKKK